MSDDTRARDQQQPRQGSLPPYSAICRLAPQERVLSRLNVAGIRWHQVRDGAEQWYADCPMCGGYRKLAFGVDEELGTVGLSCKRHCPTEEVLKALGLPMRALFPKGSGAETSEKAAGLEELARRRNEEALTDSARLAEWEADEGWTADAIDEYTVGFDREYASIPERDGRGRIVGMALYLPRSRRRQGLRRHDFTGERRGLAYPAQGVSPGSRVLLVEGGSCAVAAASLGVVAVGYPGANIAFKRGWWSVFKGCEVFLMPDMDEQGQAAVNGIVATLMPVVESVLLVRGFGPHNDIADALRAKGPSGAHTYLNFAMGLAEPVARTPRGRTPTSRTRVASYLMDALGDGQWHLASDIEAGRPCGSRDTYYRARQDLAKQGYRLEQVQRDSRHWIRLEGRQEEKERRKRRKRRRKRRKTFAIPLFFFSYVGICIYA